MDCERLLEDDSPIRAAEAAGAEAPGNPTLVEEFRSDLSTKEEGG